MKTLKANILSTILIATFISILAYINPSSLTKFNANFIDMFFNIRGDTSTSKDIAIIDIDEKSLKQLGQWPWSRDKLSKILKNLNGAGMGILGFDMIFAESDRSSPKRVLEQFGYKDKRALDYDELFADTLKVSPAILGFVFNFEQNTTSTSPRQNAIFVEKNKDDINSYIPIAKGVTTNLKNFQEKAYSAGSFNMIPDSDGVVRYVPMLFSYQDTIYPSISLEMIRAMLGVKIVTINYDTNGVESISLGEINIPTDRYGRVFVNYMGTKKSYNYISALDIYNNTFKKEDIEGKILLLGTSAAGLMDLRSTPLDSTFPGVEIHANVIDNIINTNFIQKPSYAIGASIMLIFIIVILLGMIISFLPPFSSLFFSFLYLGMVFYGFYYEMFQNGILLNILYPILALIITIFYLFFSKFLTESRQKDMIKQKFATKVSPQVVDELIKDELDLEPKEELITIFFSDIRNFTTISEEFGSASKLLKYLNIYLSHMTEIVLEHKGTIDKYIGDAIMAYWNAPLKQTYHADLCLESAIKQIQSLKELNKKLSPPMAIGIGIHSGVATVGEIGSQNRSDFTIIGDSVNLASRLEGLTKEYGAKIIISEATKNLLKKEYKIRELDRVLVKGKEKPITIYEVLGSGEFSKDEQKVENEYQQALQLYKKANFIKAKEIFETLDKSTLFSIYIKRCQELQNEDIKEFDGVYRFTTK